MKKLLTALLFCENLILEGATKWSRVGQEREHMIEDNVLAVDYETEYSRSYSLTNMPTWAYVFDDRFNAYLVSIVGDKGFKFAGHPKDFDWAQLEGKDVLHHNASFDAIVTTRLQQDGVIAEFTPANIFCTADLAACLKLPRALKEIAKHLYGDADRARKGKNARDKMKGKNAADLIDDPEILEYVIADAADSLRLWQDYNHLWLPEERELSRLNRESCFQGIKVDLEYVEDCIVRLQEQLFQAERDIPWKWPDGKTPLARKMMVAQCEKDGIPLPTQAETEKITFAKDDAAYIEWEEKYKDSFTWIKAVQNWRRKNMLLGKFMHLRDYTDEKGVYHFNKKYCGSHTGRFSGSGSFNMENLPRDEMFCDTGADGKPVKGTGFDLRHCFVASTAAGLGIIDYAQIEARILLAMVKDDAALEEIRKGTSVYEAHARATMGWTGGVLKDEDPDLYRLAKARCLGAGYGVGPTKFKDVARIMAGLELTDEESARTIADYRESNPKIVSFWRTMGRHLEAATLRGDEVFTIKLPSERTLYYWNPRKRKTRQVIKDEEGNDVVVEKENIFCQMERNNKSSYRKSYSCLIVENLTQATARDILRDAWIALAKAGYHVITTVHDEFIIDLEPGQTLEVAERTILSAGENSWASFIPLGVEGQVSMHFTK